MNYQDIENTSLNQNVYLLRGDAFLCLEAKNTFQKKLGIESINVNVFNDENFDVVNIINACNQFSFFNEKRIVVVQDIQKELSQNAKQKFEDYCKNPNKDCILLFIDTLINKVFDFLKSVEIVECKPSEMFIVNFIKDKFLKRDIKISEDNCKVLNNYCLGNLNRLNLEIKKICDYLMVGEVTKKDIDLLVYKDTELKVFDLTNALGQKDGNKSLNILNEMLKTGEAPIKILGLITGSFRRMMFAKINKGSTLDLAKVLNVKEYAIVKAKESASKFSALQLKSILNLLLETDYNIKSGVFSQENALYFLVCKIVN